MERRDSPATNRFAAAKKHQRRSHKLHAPCTTPLKRQLPTFQTPG
jgi:hypothetical protein